MTDLRHRIENLSAAEKAELLDAVWESLEADALSLTDAQRAELDRRIERHEQNPSDVIPWEQVRAEPIQEIVTQPVVWTPEANEDCWKRGRCDPAPCTNRKERGTRHPHPNLRTTDFSLSYRKQMPVVLHVLFAVRAHAHRRISCAPGLDQEDTLSPLRQSAPKRSGW